MQSSLKIDYTLLTLILLFISELTAQVSAILLQGYVLDEQSGEPVSNADVYLISVQKGTTTNQAGLFELKLTSVLPTDTLVIECIGYRPRHLPLKNYINKSRIRLRQEILPSDKSIIIYAEKVNLAGQELPHMALSLDPQQIQMYAGSDISNLFKLDPAVHIEGNDLEGRTVEIRGCDADEVNVYMDGFLLNSAGFNNAADLSVLSTTNIRRLEVLKGSNLILMGSGAFGGVINITTQKKMETEYALDLKYGSADSKYISAEMNQPLSKHLLVNYNGSWGSFAPEIEYFSSERYGIKTRATAITTYKHNHDLSLNYFSDGGQYNAKVLGYFLNYHKPSWHNYSNTITVGVSYQGNFLHGKDFEFSTQYMFTDDCTERQSSMPVTYISALQSQRMYMRLTKKYSAAISNSGFIEIQLLSEYFHDELSETRNAKTILNSNTFYQSNLYDNRASLGGVLSIGDNLNRLKSASWKMKAGMRGDFLPMGKNYRVSSLGFQIDLVNQKWTFTPYLSYGENIKFPSLLENAYRSNIIDLSLSAIYHDSVRLKPEFNNSAESGITFKFQPEDFIFNEQDISLAVFSNHTSNKILKRPLESAIVQTQLGVNTTTGIELSIRWSGLFSSWNLSLAYEQLNIENPLIYAFKPDKNFSLQLEYRSAGGFYGSSTFFYIGKSLAWDFDATNQIVTQSVSPSADLDLILGYRFKLMKLNLQIQAAGFNLRDSAGYTYYYLKKRFLQIGLTIH